LSTPSDRPELLKAYDGIQVVQDQQQVKVDIRVPEDIVEEFLRAWTR
jgi:hypothetical protein